MTNIKASHSQLPQPLPSGKNGDNSKDLNQLLNKLEKVGPASTDDERLKKIEDFLKKPGFDFEKLPKKMQSRLERFMNKVDRNNDGSLSRAELRSAADTNDDGFVSGKEKKQMRAKLNEYLSDKNAIATLSSETSRNVSEAISFLDEGSFIDEVVPPKPPKPPFHPINPLDPGYINFDDDNVVLKYSTIFCTRSKSI